MVAPTPTLSRTHRDPAAPHRGTAVLTATAALTLVATGSGLLEQHAIYPSWRTLSTFPDFAGYHSAYGMDLLPWLPLPLALATLFNGWLLVRRPAGVPRWLPVATLAGQLLVVGVTGALAIPLQQQLSTPGHSPAEIVALVDRLVVVGWVREVPGLAVAAGYLVMLRAALTHRG